jgi:excisionase family DNA binding protein
LTTNEENERLGLTVDEARKMLGIGRNLMLKLVKVEGFPAVRFKRKIIINKELLPKWFKENCGEYGDYDY